MAFVAELWRSPGPAAWVFAPVPEEHAPEEAGPFGRTPVVATVDGRTWRTSAWRGKDGRWLLPVPAGIRAGKDDGDTVTVDLVIDGLRM